MLLRTCLRSDGTLQIWRIAANGSATIEYRKVKLTDERRDKLRRSEERRRLANEKIQFGRR